MKKNKEKTEAATRFLALIIIFLIIFIILNINAIKLVKHLIFMRLIQNKACIIIIGKLYTSGFSGGRFFILPDIKLGEFPFTFSALY